MALMMTSGPAVEPVGVDEAKAHLRIDGVSEDALIASLVLTSRLHIEAALGLALIDQSWRLVLDAWPKDGIVKLPMSPVTAVSAIRVRDGEGPSTLVNADNYDVALVGRPQRIIPKSASWLQPATRAAGIEIDFIAGYGAAAVDVPAPIRQALLLLVAHWYEHRDPFEIGTPQTGIPQAVSRLLGPYRAVRV